MAERIVRDIIAITLGNNHSDLHCTESLSIVPAIDVTVWRFIAICRYKIHDFYYDLIQI